MKVQKSRGKAERVAKEYCFVEVYSIQKKNNKNTNKARAIRVNTTTITTKNKNKKEKSGKITKKHRDSTQQVILRISFSRAIYIISANIAKDGMIVFSVHACMCFLSISFTSLLPLSYSDTPNF